AWYFRSLDSARRRGRRGRVRSPARQQEGDERADGRSGRGHEEGGAQVDRVCDDTEQHRGHAAEPHRETDRHAGGGRDPRGEVLLAHEGRETEAADEQGAGKRHRSHGDRAVAEGEDDEQGGCERQAAGEYELVAIAVCERSGAQRADRSAEQDEREEGGAVALRVSLCDL